MRLIDADAFKEQVAAMTFKENYSIRKANAMIQLIDMQPTADLDKLQKDAWDSGHSVGYSKGYDERSRVVMRGGRNQEGYTDPTASIAVGQMSREENEVDKRAYDLIKVLKYIIKGAGFELMERVQVKDIKTGRVYK